jgi:hypothetical protein
MYAARLSPPRLPLDTGANTGMLRSKVALSRFIDDISALAVEDSLISKLPTLFRSNKVLAMSSEERSRLAGEKADSARERSHLIGKRTVLKAGLQNLKSVLKSKNILDLPEKQARMPARDIQKEPYNWTPQRSGRASTDSIRAVPDLPSSGSGIAVSRSAEQRTPEGGTQTAQDEFWSRVRAPQEKKRMDVESGSVKDFEPGWGQ